jgi:hypothetical protein
MSLANFVKKKGKKVKKFSIDGTTEKEVRNSLQALREPCRRRGGPGAEHEDAWAHVAPVGFK